MDELTQELAALEVRSLRRRLRVVEEVLPGGKVRVAGQVRLNLSSNDYLGLALDPRLIDGGLRRGGPVGRGGRGLPLWWWGIWACTRRWKPELADVQGD